MRRLLVIMILFCASGALAQYPRVDIPGSEVRKISSSIVTGQEYELQILLPGNYKQADKKYPVVYLMDAQWDFPLVKSIYGQQYYDGFIPELIIVGVTWGGVNPNPDALRVRDYTPTKEARSNISGGADKFLDFMQQELFPFMESNYRADSLDRVLMGCSLGGLFTLYTLFTRPDMFTGYAAASPAIGWDRQVLERYEKEFAAKQLKRPVRLYMTIGDVERGRPAYELFAKKMLDRKYPGTTMLSKVLENTGHSGTKSETYSRGLQHVFERNRLVLPDELLTKYAGKYILAGGFNIELKKEGQGLAWYSPDGTRTPLLVNSTTHLYATHEFFNLYYKINNGNVEGFDLVRYGNKLFARKSD